MAEDSRFEVNENEKTSENEYSVEQNPEDDLSDLENNQSKDIFDLPINESSTVVDPVLGEEEKVNIVKSHNSYYVWRPKEFYTLKLKCRIVGKLIGPTPRAPRNSQHLGLPLSLCKEEVTLLLEKNLARLIEHPDLGKEPSQDIKNAYENLQKKLLEEQRDLCTKQEEENLSKRIDQIVEGKRRKIEKKFSNHPNLNSILNDITPENVYEEERQRIRKLPENKMVVQTYLQSPFIDHMATKDLTWDYPRSSNEILRYKIFKDLWEKKYFVTNGLNFGVDLLAYPGDPLVYHANLCIHIVEDEKELNFLNLICKARLSTNVKKTFVMASCDENGKVHYLSWQWNGK